MDFEYSSHWIRKKNHKKDITQDIIEYSIINSNKYKDRNWEDIFNAISNIPPSNRTLKVVYKIKGKTIKIITTYWLN